MHYIIRIINWKLVNSIHVTTRDVITTNRDLPKAADVSDLMLKCLFFKEVTPPEDKSFNIKKLMGVLLYCH